MNRTAWIVIGALCIIGLGGLVVFTKKDTVDVGSVDPFQIIATTDTALGDNVTGNKEAKVVVYEYADFQCPGCAGAHQNLPAIQDLYGEKVAFVFRTFPLTTIHANALAASTAAEAAGMQGKFWEMHDILYNNQDGWASLSTSTRGDAFLSYASQIGLNTDQFTNDLSNKKIQAKIQLDRALGNKVNVTETPTFFIDNSKVSSDVVTDMIQNTGTQFMDELDKALKSAGVTPPSR